MNTSRRAAGLGLLAYGIVTPVALMISQPPGGDYVDSDIAKYISSGHRANSIALAFLAGIAAFGILVFANRMRHELRSGGDVLWGLAVTGTALSVIGWFLLGGMATAFAIGGESLASGVPHPVVYLVGLMSLMVGVVSSSFFVGIAAWVLAAKALLPGWLRIASYVGGLGGLLGVIYMPLFLLWLWAIVFSLWAVMAKASSTHGAPA
jgi:hypothetical protein